MLKGGVVDGRGTGAWCRDTPRRKGVAAGDEDVRHDGAAVRLQADLGFGRIVISETEVPNMVVALV
jgi:hypothetical protein